MERAGAELVRHGQSDVDFIVLSSDLAADLRGTVEWRRIRLPRRPSVLRLITFFVVAGWKLRKIDAEIRHTTGAIVPNRISLATVHYCHVGFRSKTGRRVVGGSSIRRLNTAVHRVAAELGERWVYRTARTKGLAAVSDGVADELREHFPGVEIEVVPNGVDLDRFRPDAQARQELRLDENVAEHELVALFVGGDWARKGLDVAIRGVGLALAEGLPVRLWVVGAGDRARLGRLADSCGAGDSVRFFGQRRDTERFYAASDLFLLPSAYETFSLVAYEAAATGLPVVATAVSGVAELVRDGGGGLIVDASASSIRDALKRLALDSTERGALGSAARSWAGRFTWKASAEATVNLYRRYSS
jgi:glycosyltransferase involved in cell wall biosynthesis